MKDLLTRKGKTEETSKIILNESCSAVLLNKIPFKEKDPGSFTIPCVIVKVGIDKALAGLGANISLMSYSMYASTNLWEEEDNDLENLDKAGLHSDHDNWESIRPTLFSTNTIEAEKQPPKLKELPSHLEYAFLNNNQEFPVIISSLLNSQEKESLLKHSSPAALSRTGSRCFSLTEAIRLFRAYGSDALAETACFESNSSAQQDALILSVIEQLKTQLVRFTKINLENKSVNDTLTAEVKRYKEQVKVLKEGQNVDLRSNNNVSDSCAQSIEIDRLKQTLSEHLKEKESLMQTKAQQLEPKLYDGNVIKNMSAIVIPDSEETLMLPEESRSKMLLKQKDPTMLEKKVNTTSVDYAIPTLSFLVDPPKLMVQVLPKVSMVNTSLKKLKYHLVGFDVVVKERTTPTAITEGSWGVSNLRLSFKRVSLKKRFTINCSKVLPLLKKHLHTLEVDSQLNQENFQRENSVLNQSDPSFDKYFELNELKAQSQEKDTMIKKLKERIKSLSRKINENKIKKDLEEIETINIELDHRVSKLIAENEHLKQTYKQLYNSIKPTVSDQLEPM
ncbi:hypothetical protein Tco_0531321 [Tanacetum coccineum]